MKTYEQADKTYNKTCATSEDADWPAHPQSDQSLHWLHVPSTASRLSKGDKPDPLPYRMDVPADLSPCWSLRSCSRFCHVLAHIWWVLIRSHRGASDG